MARVAGETAGQWYARALVTYYRAQAALMMRRDGQEPAAGSGAEHPGVWDPMDQATEQQVSEAFAEWHAASRAVLADRIRP